METILDLISNFYHAFRGINRYLERHFICMIPRNTAAVTKMGIKSEIYLITNDGEQTSDKKDAMLHLFCGQTKLKRKQNFFFIKSNIYCFSFSLKVIFFTIICLTLRFLWLVFNLFSNDSISSEQKKRLERYGKCTIDVIFIIIFKTLKVISDI